MTEQELDRTLERLFHEALDIPREEEDVLWLRFVQRRSEEEAIWFCFRQMMLQASARLQQAVEWTCWPARGVPGLT